MLLGIAASIGLGAIFDPSHAASPAATNATADAPSPKVSFNRDVRPILSDKCFRCHGPDAASRQGDLRLDRRADAVAAREGPAIITPGKPESSELIARIDSHDADLRMPPADSELVLSETEREVLRRWIAEGAEYEPHWSFQPVVRPTPPQVRDSSGIRNAIDNFVRARLEQQKLQPSPEADPETLCRRLYLDLIGLPPTPAEVASFTKAYVSLSPGLPVSRSETKDKATRRQGDKEREAVYEALVDRLLASPHFGENMARPWLDAARYADTNGYQTDGPRHMWRWRDWVIDAYNRNLPFDQFTIEQLAGDLLPQPRLDQQIATGFNRNHRMNAEGGIIAEEFLAEYVADRVETTSTVWLGLTMGCARCHDHKYDPLSQRDFYRMFAFFNNVPEPGKAIRDDNSPPFISAPTVEQQARLKQLDTEIAAAEKRWIELEPQARREMLAWAPSQARNPSQWTVTDGLSARYPFDGALKDETDPKIEVVASSAPRFSGGPFGEAIEFDGNDSATVKEVLPFDSEAPFSSSVWIKPAAPQSSGTIYASVDADMSSLGVELRLVKGRVELVLAARVLDDVIRIESKAEIPAGEWTHLAWTYRGIKTADQVQLYIDGRPVETRIVADTLSNKFKASENLTIGSNPSGSGFRGRVADLRFYSRQLSNDEISVVFCGLSIRTLAQQAEAFGNPASALKLFEYYLAHDGHTPFGQARDALRDLQSSRRLFVAQLPTTMVMRDQPGLRTTHILTRGEYDKPGAAVTSGVPSELPELSTEGAVNRLALARWLVDGRNPLTARVAVNRLWQQFFGVGLVKTAEDFGSQGEWPAHAALLDWLAAEFQEGDRPGDRSSLASAQRLAPGVWDVKHLIKLIVTSATYRQSSQVTAAQLARDPDNRLLARGARFRLSAEGVRDAALQASGLLKSRIGGPSVKPYQPDGLWEELASSKSPYEQSRGDDLYRRSLYTYRKRTVGPPGLMIFDAAGREACVVRSARTNTPLQALNLLNDVTYVEASRVLAERMMRDGGESVDARVAFGFRCAMSRQPSREELAVLRRGYERRLEEFRRHQDRAKQLLEQGASPVDDRLDAAELAAYATVAGVIFNLDEFVTRQ